jgi:hypothetical protein
MSIGDAAKESGARPRSRSSHYISHCLYDETEIKHYQAANEISKPLDSLTPSEQNRVLADVCRKIKAAATPKSPPQTQAEHGALVSAISSYNRPPSGPLSSGPALGPDAQEILELMEQEPDSKMRILAERIFPPEHNRSTSTRTYEYRVR